MAETPGDRRPNWTIRLAAVAIVLAAVVVFIAENFVIVELRLITWEVQVRLAWAMLAAGGLGLVAGLLLPRPWR